MHGESQPTFYPKNNPDITVSPVHSRFTRTLEGRTMFGERLREKLDAAGMKPAELARRSGVTKQNIGRLLNNTPHSITGALPKPERDTVEKLARALDWEINDALLSAGYAPSAPEDRHKLPKGVTIYYDETSHLTDEQKDKVVSLIRTLIAGVLAEDEQGK